MSHNSGFFPSQNGDREYNADDFRKFIMSFVGDGLTRIDGDESGFEVIAENPASMNVVVGKGSAIIKGSWLNPDSNTTISIPTASSSGNRYDAIVLEFNNTVGTRAVTISVVQGTASANPDYPDMIDTDSIKQLPIAYVYVGIGVTSIDDSNIIDNRGTNSCPYASATMDRQELVLPIASNTTLGAIKVGRNLRIEADGTLNATGGGGGGASALSDLEDVDIDFSTLASGQALIYDDTDDMWKNENAETEPPSLADLPDVNIEDLQFGQILRFNSTNGKWENCNWNELPINKTFEKQANVENLATGRYRIMSAKAGNQIIFAGGLATGSYNVDAYNDSLTRTMPLPLSQARSDGAGSTAGDYAIFAGGTTNYAWSYTGSPGGTNYQPHINTAVATVDAYDSSLTKVTISNLPANRIFNAGASVGNNALFAGGHTESTSSMVYSALYRDLTAYKTITAYDDSLTRNDALELSSARTYLSGVSFGNKALFGGGTNSGHECPGYSAGTNIAAQKTVDVVDASLTVSTAPDLTTARYHMTTAGSNTTTMFAGGNGGGTVIEPYDDSLTKQSALALTSSRVFPDNVDGGYNNNWYLFSGANSNANVDAYDDSFVRMAFTGYGFGEALDPARTYLKMGVIGQYFVFAGGYANSASSDVVEAYKVNHY